MTPEQAQRSVNARILAALDLVADDRHDLALAQIEYERCRNQLHAAVQVAREFGATWQQIGDTLDTTRQAAQQTYGA